MRGMLSDSDDITIAASVIVMMWYQSTKAAKRVKKQLCLMRIKAV